MNKLTRKGVARASLMKKHKQAGSRQAALRRGVVASGKLRVCPPPELAGQWVAWSRDGRRIVAHGVTLVEVRRDAAAKTGERVVFEKLPPASRYLASLGG